jgi:hypothetical protein
MRVERAVLLRQLIATGDTLEGIFPFEFHRLLQVERVGDRLRLWLTVRAGEEVSHRDATSNLASW